MFIAEREYSDYGIKLNIKEIKDITLVILFRLFSGFAMRPKKCNSDPVEDKGLCRKIDEMTDKAV